MCDDLCGAAHGHAPHADHVHGDESGPLGRVPARRIGRRALLGGAAGLGAGLALGARPGFAAGTLPGPGAVDPGFEAAAMGEDPARLGAVAARTTLDAATATPPGRLRPVHVPAPPIVTRAQWGADETLVTTGRSFAPLRKFVVHHTASANNPADPTAVMRAILTHHTQDRGWADVGYNFVIDHRGVVYEGRFSRASASGEPVTGEDGDGNLVVGAHASGFNTGTCGICLIGTFLGQPPTEAALTSLARVIAWKAGPRGIDPLAADPFTRFDGTTVTLPNIVGHGDVGATLCPGDMLRALLPRLRQAVRLRLGTGLVGYRVATSDGTITSFGEIADGGDVRRAGGRDAVAIAGGTGPDAYLSLTADGGVWAFGGAAFKGSLHDQKIRARAVDIAATPTGGGYWVLTREGEVVPFGDAVRTGSVPSVGVRTTCRRIRPTATGAGYWILGSDGGVFCFGDAPFLGSLPGIGVRTRAVDLQPTPSGRGYWLLGEDGGVFSFGDATFHGSIPGLRLPWARPAVALMAATDGTGYHVLAGDGGVFSFGSVPFFGSIAGSGRRPVGIAAAIAGAAPAAG
jgi:hypothetical protein